MLKTDFLEQIDCLIESNLRQVEELNPKAKVLGERPATERVLRQLTEVLLEKRICMHSVSLLRLIQFLAKSVEFADK